MGAISIAMSLFGGHFLLPHVDLAHTWVQWTECLYPLQILIPNMMSLGGEVSEKYLGHQGGAPMNGISILIKGILSAT